MKHRFSSIRSKEELQEAINHTHLACFTLCKRALGKYLPVAGNIGIFCHDEEEFKFLTKLREELTDANNNWNQKYYRLHNPLIISAEGDIPATTYTYLYIRRPDPTYPEIGDVDFVLKGAEFSKLKEISQKDNKINNVEILYRPDLDMVRLKSSEIDALAYITSTFMTEKGI